MGEIRCVFGECFFQDLDAHSKLEDGAIGLLMKAIVNFEAWGDILHLDQI